MQNKPLAIQAAALMAVAVVPMLSQDSRSQHLTSPADRHKTYRLSTRYAVGDLLNYKTQMSMTLAMSDARGSPLFTRTITMKCTTRMKTVGLQQDGSAVIAVRAERGEIYIPGNVIPTLGDTIRTPDLRATMMVVDPRGVGKLRVGERNAGVPQPFTQMFDMNQMPPLGAVLPYNPVDIGDTWETDLPMPLGGRMKVSSRLLGIGKIGGGETLEIKQVVTMPFEIKLGPDLYRAHSGTNVVAVARGSGVVDGVLTILKANARLVKMVADVKGDIALEVTRDAAPEFRVFNTTKMRLTGKMFVHLTSASKVPLPINHRRNHRLPKRH